MSTILAIRPLNRSNKIGLGNKDVVSGKTTFVNIENKRVARDFARHTTLGQIVPVNPPRFQLDTGVVDGGGLVVPRTASLVVDVSAVNYTTNVDGVARTAPAVALTATPNAVTPLVHAIGVDTTSSPGTSVLATEVAASANNTESRVTTFPGSLTLANVGSVAARTWLALVWTPPAFPLTTPFGVAATGVFTAASHPYVVGDPVWFSVLTGPTGIAISTLYYVNTVPDANTFTVSLTRGGPTLTFTTNASAGTVNRQILASDVLDIRP